MRGIFGLLFDFNRNGNLEPNEQAMECGFFLDLVNKKKNDTLSIDELIDYDMLDDD